MSGLGSWYDWKFEMAKSDDQIFEAGVCNS